VKKPIVNNGSLKICHVLKAKVISPRMYSSFMMPFITKTFMPNYGRDDEVYRVKIEMFK